MNREIKFRAFDKDFEQMIYSKDCESLSKYFEHVERRRFVKPEFSGMTEDMLYTGLKDKDGYAFIYEGDIVSLEGILIGNQYETPDLLQDPTNLVITGMGTKKWSNTEQEACKRGCYYAQ
jgi:hypothetical protein